MKVKVKLHGLCCANCAAKIEEKVSKLVHVDSAVVNFLTEKMIFTAEAAHLDAIKAEIQQIVHKIEPDVEIEYI